MNFATTLRRHAELRPQAVALVSEHHRLTYGDLDAAVDDTVAVLAALGTEPGDRVAVLLPNVVAFVDIYFATMRFGAVFVPLNVRLSPDEVAHQLRDSGARVMFSHPSVQETATAACSAAETRCVVVDADAPWKAQWVHDGSGRRRDDAVATPDDVQRIIYTSGTTSRPKGTIITHGQVWWGALTRCAEFAFTPADVTLTVAPLYHVGGLDSFTTSMLMVGGGNVLLPRFDPVAVLDAITQHGVTNTWLAPTLLRQVFDAADGHAFVATTLRVVLGGGEKAPEPVIRRLHDLWRGAGYYDAYGLTECQGIATYLDAAQSLSRIGSVGRPALAREIVILDEAGHVLPPRQKGEICIRGPVVTPGYWRDPQATVRTIRDGWLHTGDIGYLDEDGYLWIVDRLKDMIRSGLENVASSEVERVLYEHAGVAEAAVVARPDERWGEVPVAFVVPRGEPPTDTDLLDYCRARLAPFKVPRSVTFVPSLPRTASGKVQKHQLRNQVRRQADVG